MADETYPTCTHDTCCCECCGPDCGCDCDDRAEVWVDTPDDFAGYSRDDDWDLVEVVITDAE